MYRQKNNNNKKEVIISERGPLIGYGMGAFSEYVNVNQKWPLIFNLMHLVLSAQSTRL